MPSKSAVGTGEHALRYLSRYVYRLALSNHALESFTDGRVTFRYTHAQSHETKRLPLPVDAFIGRFLQHILPTGLLRPRAHEGSTISPTSGSATATESALEKAPAQIPPATATPGAAYQHSSAVPCASRMVPRASSCGGSPPSSRNLL